MLGNIQNTSLAKIFFALLLVNAVLNFTRIAETWNDFIENTGYTGYAITLLFIISVGLIFELFTKNHDEHYEANLINMLSVIASVAPSIGFLGTLIGIKEGLEHYDSATSTEQLLEINSLVISGLALAFTSTLGGVAITIINLPICKYLEKNRHISKQKETHKSFEVQQHLVTEQYMQLKEQEKEIRKLRQVIKAIMQNRVAEQN